MILNKIYNGCGRDLSDSSMVIGTSVVIDTEMDGVHAGTFLENLQIEINRIK